MQEPIKLPPRAARAGVISGRVITVLIVSLTMALLAMALLLGYFYASYSPPSPS